MIDEFSLEIETFEDGLNINYAIMDVEGKLVQKHTNLAESIAAGKHIFMLSAKDLTPGIYTMRISTGALVVNKKLIVVNN